VEGQGIFRIEAGRLVVIRDGAVVVALVAVGEAATVEGRGVFRIEPNRLVVIRDGAVVIALRAVRDASTEVSTSNLIEEIRDGAVVVTFPRCASPRLKYASAI
jgi:hypothetical protein